MIVIAEQLPFATRCYVKQAGLFMLCIVITSANVFYVTPSSSTPCPERGVPCSTLSAYAIKNVSYNFPSSNTTLILLPGSHNLEKNLQFKNNTFIGIHRLNFAGPYNTVTINCVGYSKFIFANIEEVTIHGIVFNGCVGNTISSVKKFTLKNCHLNGQGRNGTGLDLNHVANASIAGSSFSRNTGKLTFVEDASFDTPIFVKQGGALVVDNSNVFISGSAFKNNNVRNSNWNVFGGAVFINSSNVSLYNSLFVNNSLNARKHHAFGGAVYALVNDYGSNNTASNFFIYGTTFSGNSVAAYDSTGSGGGICLEGVSLNVNSMSVTIKNSAFFNNNVIAFGSKSGAYGGALRAKNDQFPFNLVNAACISVVNTTFIKNSVRVTAGWIGEGGAISTDQHSTLHVDNGSFINNSVTVIESPDVLARGGVVTVFRYSYIIGSIFTLNTVNIFRSKSKFNYLSGGAIFVQDCNMSIINSTFTNNAMYMIESDFGDTYGGALALYDSTVYMNNSRLVENIAGHGGAISLAESSNLTLSGLVLIRNNHAKCGAIFVLSSRLCLSGNIVISNNTGYPQIQHMNLSSSRYTIQNLRNGIYQPSKEGGGLSLHWSELIFTCEAKFIENRAMFGGALFATGSKLYFDHGNITIALNYASVSGGGFFLYQSEMNLKVNMTVYRNTASEYGGGIHAISSLFNLIGAEKSDHLKADQVAKFKANHAKKGGGIYLEAISKIYIIKNKPEFIGVWHAPWLNLEFLENSAEEYGGALYVSDDTNTQSCLNQTTSDVYESQIGECFIQTVCHGIYNLDPKSVINIQNTYFRNNTAKKGGAILYGGLLDRCKVNPFAEIFISTYTNIGKNALSGITYFLNITNLHGQDLHSVASVSSNPVRICFCLEGNPNCSYQLPTKLVRRGEHFTVSVAAVDQVNNTIPDSIIYAFLSSEKGGIGEQQGKQKVNESCTSLVYSVFSPYDYATLNFYPEGPCKDLGISKRRVDIKFLSCPLGFEYNNKNSSCQCAKQIASFVDSCSTDTKTVITKAKDSFWINYSKKCGYVGHRCPFDYCNLPPNHVNLSEPNGSDSQCAFHRRGILCGECDIGLSISLGSSNCKDCSNYWLLLTIPFMIAGITLVVFLLVCNMTVAVGTINGLVFYANIIEANRAVFLPVKTGHKTSMLSQNPLTIFISWINLDLGIETCFYNGMTAYAKTWLQLIFPIYIIFLVIVIIIVSKYSKKFSKLLTTNPVATLATLILLSYTKLLRAIITALSVAKLNYQNINTSNSHTVWLIDANIEYFEFKHTILFVTCVILLILGFVYTFLLVSWQLLYPVITKSVYFRTSRLIIGTNHFMDAYHAPYKPRHRYWAGLLLLLRALLFLISAINVHLLDDPRVSLVAIIVAVIFLLLLQTFVLSIYKQWFVNFLETSFFVNLGLLATTTIIITDIMDPEHISAKAAAVYVSTSVAFITFILIVIYHFHTFLFKNFPTSSITNFMRNRRGYVALPNDNLEPMCVQGLREPLDLIDEKPTMEDYRKAAQSYQSLSQSNKHAATHSEVILN